MAEARIAGRYEPLEVVGRGGEATVIKAVDIRHDRLVALKIRANGTHDGADHVLREARALLSLPPHRGLAHARDDLFDGGRHVLVLDWVDGINLARLLADAGRPGLPVSSVLRWVAQAAEALTVLHRHGVVHGDVKPANLVLDRDGRVVVVDLGSSSARAVTVAQGGTPRYRAPEVAGGLPATPASDVFSLAATAFALLTGAPPAGAMPSWNGIPDEVATRLEVALRAGLAIDPIRRPATPGELVERLRAGWADRTPTGVATVLLTDVVGSTALWERAPDEVPALLAEMQLVIDRSVEDHGGARVGATVEGDTTISTFPNAVDAVCAAVDVQRALCARPGVRVRAGLATGELVVADDEVFGTPVNRAARVRELAGVGEIVLSRSTADVVGAATPPGVDLLPLGPHVLRGLDGTDEVSAVVADGVSTPPDPRRSPYPGLAAFGPLDADLFFGREGAVDRCLELFSAHRFVAVVGASGSGKTSLALAGLAPPLGDCIVVRPGSDPRRALEDADLDQRAGAVLIVDQLEELLTLCHDTRTRAACVDLMCNHPGGLVITVRADFYGELGVFSELAHRLATSQVLLGPLDESDLVRAVDLPAGRCGLEVEAGLAALITAEIGNAPGALPLLGHALREAWLRRTGRTITIAGYRASGGVRSAIAATAEQTLDRLDESGQQVARHVLLRMVEVRTDGEDTRRWAPRRELDDVEPERAAAVVATLADARLLVVDGDQITVVHEALLQAWPRLNEWIVEERAALLKRQELRWAAHRWTAGGWSEADLYRGLRLESAAQLANLERLPADESAFVEAGQRLRDRESNEARRRSRRLRLLAGAAFVLAVVALIGGGIALLQRNEAQRSRDEAEQSRTGAEVARADAEQAQGAAEQAQGEAEQSRDEADEAARSARIEALVGRTESLRVTQRDAAALLAVQAFRLADTARSRSALLATFTDDERFLDAHRLDQDGGSNGIVLPDGQTAYLVGPDGRLLPYDLETGELGPALLDLGVADQFAVLAASADGQLLAQAAWIEPDTLMTSTKVAVVDRTNGALRFAPLLVDGGVDDVTFSPQGDHLGMVTAAPRRLIIVDVATGTIVSDAPLPGGDLGGSGIATVGDEFVVVVGDGSMRVFDPATGGLRRTMTAAPKDAGFLFPVGDGTVVSTGQGGQARIDVATGAVLWDRAGENCMNVAVLVDRGTLYCGDMFGRLEERDLDTGVVLRQLNAQNGNSGALWPADGGAELVSFGDNEALVARWRLDGSGPITRVIAPGMSIESFQPAGDQLLVFDLAGDHHAVVDVATGGSVAQLTSLLAPVWLDDDTILAAVLDEEGLPAGTRVELADGTTTNAGGTVFDPAPDEAITESGKARSALVYRDGQDADIVSFDLATAQFGPRIAVPGFVSVAINRSGDRLAAGTREGVVVYDATTGAELGRIPGGELRGAYITITDQLFVSSLGGELTQYDLETLAPVRTFGGSRGYVVRLAGTADGSIIAVNGGDRTVTLYDVATGTRLGTPIRIADDADNYVALEQSGTTLAVGGGLGRTGIEIWDLDPQHWVDAACRIAGRNLTREEWDANIGDLAAYAPTCRDLPFDG